MLCTQGKKGVGLVVLKRARSPADRQPARAPSLRLILCLGILVAQFAIAALYHLGERRYFAWAPNDYVVTYELQVTLGGRLLTPDEVNARYRLGLDLAPLDRLTPEVRSRLGISQGARYMWEDPAQHLIDRIQLYEQTYGSVNPARVRLVYQVANGELQEWRWPT